MTRILVGIGCLAAVGVVGYYLGLWVRFRCWHMMAGRRLRDRLRWIRALHRIERGLRKEARAHYAEARR